LPARIARVCSAAGGYPAGWLATISYSLYLSHKIAFHIVATTLGARLQGHDAIAFVTYAVVVLMLGAALHYLVERPCLRLRERRAIRRVSMPVTADDSGLMTGPG
jgi:peptidoglycan/LPS O-acetylase OafA/YrhL